MKLRLTSRRFTAGALLLVLLGTGMLLRARLPRPQTPTDAWLWSRAEAASELAVATDAETAARIGLKDGEVLRIADRQGIRRALRAFKGTSSFTPYRGSTTPVVHPAGMMLYVMCAAPISRDDLGVAEEPRGFYLCANSPPRIATTDARSVARLYEALRAATYHARRHTVGYAIS